MGAGAVNGYGRETAGGTENQTDPSRKFYSNSNTSNGYSGNNSQTSSPSTDNLPKKQPFPKVNSKFTPAAPMKMSCDRCSVNFTIFKRKKCCQECQRFFCSSCLPKPQSSSIRQCSKCRLLMSGHFSRDDLQTWKINDMRCFLNVRNISTKECREKHDLIELVLARFCTIQRQSVQDLAAHETLVQQMAAHLRDVSFVNDSSSSQTSHENSPVPQRSSQSATSSQISVSAASQTSSANQPSSTSDQTPPAPEIVAAETSTDNLNNTAASQVPEAPSGFQFEIQNETLRELLENIERIRANIGQREETEQSAPVEPPVRRTNLNDITELSDIDDLSTRQLKELLVNNFVDYKGCCEKPELVEKTKRLWKDHQENQIRAQRIHKQDEAACYDSQPKNNKPEVISVSGRLQEQSTLSQAASISEAAEGEKTVEDAASSNTTLGETASANDKGLQNMPNPAATSSSTAELNPQVNDSLCHICMDSLVDCILLECGHMVTCTQCGKRLSTCPMCRQYIVRVVRVFRS